MNFTSFYKFVFQMCFQYTISMCKMYKLWMNVTRISCGWINDRRGNTNNVQDLLQQYKVCICTNILRKFQTTYLSKASLSIQLGVMYFLQAWNTFDNNMFIHPRWIMMNDYKWPNGSIQQLGIDNGSTTSGNNMYSYWNEWNTTICILPWWICYICNTSFNSSSEPWDTNYTKICKSNITCSMCKYCFNLNIVSLTYLHCLEHPYQWNDKV